MKYLLWLAVPLLFTACATAPVKPIQAVRTSTQVGQLQLSTSVEPEKRSGGSYYCDIKESAEVDTGEYRYEIMNLRNKTSRDPMVECKAIEFQARGNMRYFFVRHEDANEKSTVQLTFRRGTNGYMALPEWFDFEYNAEQLNADSLVQALADLNLDPHGLDHPLGAEIWWRMVEDKKTGAKSSTMYFNKSYKRTLTTNGQEETLCSANGEQWKPC